MKIERIEVFPVRLPLKATARLSRGVPRTIEEGKRVILVKMTADDGTVGWGEAGPSRRWSAETTESCHSSIKHYLAPVLIGRDPFDLAGLHAARQPRRPFQRQAERENFDALYLHLL